MDQPQKTEPAIAKDKYHYAAVSSPPPAGCRLDPVAYSWLRKTLMGNRVVPSNSGHSNEELEYAELRGTLRHNIRNGKLALAPRPEPETSPTSGNCATVAASPSFLCEAALRRTGDEDASAAVRRYLMQLNIVAPPTRQIPDAAASHCETFTQDADLSSSTATKSGEASVDERNTDAIDQTLRARAVDGEPVFPPSALQASGSLTRTSQNAVGNVEQRDRTSNAAPSPTSSFLFASTPSLIKGAMGRITCLEFCPIPTIGAKPTSTDPASASSRDVAHLLAAPGTSFVACGTSTGDVWLLLVTARGSSAGENICVASHRGEVTDVNWSDDGRLLLSVSADATVAVWDVARREKIRECNTLDPALCGRFLPQNNNFFIVGVASKAAVRVFNLSTGMHVKNIKVADPVHSLAMDNSGLFTFTASSKGVLQAFAMLLDISQIRKVSALLVGQERQLRAIAWQAGYDSRVVQHPSSGAVRLSRTDYLAANVVDAVLVVSFHRTFRGAGESSAAFLDVLRSGTWCGLHVLRSIPMASPSVPQRAAFCERPTPDSNIVIACGAYDGCVHLKSFTGTRSDEVVALSPGYPCAPSCVAWDASNTVLVTGTETGDVLAWRRFRISGGDAFDAVFQRNVAAGGPDFGSPVNALEGEDDGASADDGPRTSDSFLEGGASTRGSNVS